MAAPIDVEVVLVDGVGTGVVYWCDRDQFALVVNHRRFERVPGEFNDGREVYRLVGVEGAEPEIRHITKYVAANQKKGSSP